MEPSAGAWRSGARTALSAAISSRKLHMKSTAVTRMSELPVRFGRLESQRSLRAATGLLVGGNWGVGASIPIGL